MTLSVKEGRENSNQRIQTYFRKDDRQKDSYRGGTDRQTVGWIDDELVRKEQRDREIRNQKSISRRMLDHIPIPLPL